MDDAGRVNEIIGKRIRDIRVAKKMSQQELAVRADLSLPHISDIELGKKSMKLVTFIRILEALKVSADAILQVNISKAKQQKYDEFSQLLEDCTPSEAEMMKTLLLQMKETLRKTQSAGE